MKKKKIAPYVRVSTKSHEQDHSYESQKDFFENEVLKLPQYKDFEIYKIYSDKDTATRFKRKGFLEMLYDAGIDVIKVKNELTFHTSDREPKFNRILVTNLSRFARDIAVITPIRKLSEKGVYIDFLSDNKSTENESDMMYIELMFTFAANESRDKSIKVRDGLKRTASRGQLFTHQLYGYDYLVGEKKLVINEKEAEVVKLIFDLYIQGYGFRRIINYLTSKGIYTRNGKIFTISAIKRILTNEKYAGILIRNKWDSGVVFSKHSPRVKPSEYVFEGVIPAIISKEKFFKAQSIREGKIQHQNQKGIYRGTSKYANMLVCGKCGGSYVRNAEYDKKTKQLRYHFFNCTNKKKKGVQFCNSKNVREEWIDWAVNQFANEGILTTIEEFKQEYIIELQYIKKLILDKIDKQQEDLAIELRSKLNDLQEQKKRIAKLYLTNKYTDEELNELVNEIDDEYGKIDKQLKEVSMSNEEIYFEASKIDEVIEKIKDFRFSSENDDILDIITRITIQEFEGIIDINTDKKLNKKILVFNFEFKMFKSLFQIAEKYLSDDIKKTFGSISIFLPLGDK